MPRKPAALLATIALLGALPWLGGCAAPSVGSNAPPPPARSEAPSAGESVDTGAVSAALAYHQRLQAMSAGELSRERAALAVTRDTPQRQLHEALLAAHPRIANLARARALLEGVLANRSADARAVHALARLLLAQVQERQRLDAANERLTQQLEHTGQQLKETRQLGEDLQRKLDALTEIERSLPAARPAMPAMPAVPAPARTPQ